MSSPSNDNHPDGDLRTYSAVLPPGITFGSPARQSLGPTRTYTASGLPPGLRLNPTIGVGTGTTPADKRPSAPEDEVKPDLLIDPPKPKPDDPQQPPNNPGP